jgi:hypothetical protein
MKKLVGHKITVWADGKSVVGKLMKDFPDRILVEGKDKNIITVIKNKISMFFSSGDYTGPALFILGCDNAETGCRGVKYVKEGEPVEKDYDVFMHDCPMRDKNCKHGNLGSLFTVDSDVLIDMLKDTLYGDYPEGEE